MNTPQHFAERLKNIVKRLEYGCGNHGCKIKKPVGQGTNAPCNCKPRFIADELLDIANDLSLQGRWEK